MKNVITNAFAEYRAPILFLIMAALLIIVGFIQSWNLAFSIINLCLISAIMTLGVNVQWGYAGLVNFGVMGFAALGGLAAILVSAPPVPGAWAVGGTGIIVALLTGIFGIIVATITWQKTKHLGKKQYAIMGGVILIALIIFRLIIDPSIAAIEAFDAAKYGYLGGAGLPIVISWAVGGVLAAGAAWVIGKISLGLRSDYLAIATLGISEIVIFVLKNEDWLTRGVKNVVGLPRPVPYEIDLQNNPTIIAFTERYGFALTDTSSLIVKMAYALLFTIVLLVIFFLAEIALKSPWGRMMRAIRDNEVSASAMGKNVKAQHLQVFIIGSAIIGVAGAMLTTLDGQFTPTSYQPLRFTFLIWIMVIVGGSGNNLGAIIGGFFVWFFWIEAEPLGLLLVEIMTAGMDENNPLKMHLIDNAIFTRLMTMGLVLLLTLRFAPRGLIPEVKR